MKLFFGGIMAVLLGAGILRGQTDERGRSVVVVYNSGLADSKRVAEHYAAMRKVPADQVLGLAMNPNETMSRAEYREQLQHPLLRFLQTNRFLVYDPGATKPFMASVRYVVLCYGVPLRIAEDPALHESTDTNLAEAFRRNGAAVDSELALLPDTDPSLPLGGPLRNPLYGTTDSRAISPTNGLLIVARLDGPSADIAYHLVDKAMDAETNGLWGRAYFDLRGLTSGPYVLGDEWIGAASKMTRNYGFETVEDDNPETFPTNFPMSQIALYAGWYDSDASGPFACPPVEFMPGAFAYHLYSFSANTLRSTTKNWCGPFLAEGATATMGCVDEPYLEGTPNIEYFFARWMISAFTYGEAATACQRVLSWQTTVIGDPLYRPFGQDPRQLHEALERRHSPMLAWSYVRVVNLSLKLGRTPGEMIKYLSDTTVPQDSPVLEEKLGDLYKMERQMDLAEAAYRRALRFGPTPRQRMRLEQDLAADPRN